MLQRPQKLTSIEDLIWVYSQNDLATPLVRHLRKTVEKVCVLYPLTRKSVGVLKEKTKKEKLQSTYSEKVETFTLKSRGLRSLDLLVPTDSNIKSAAKWLQNTA